MTLCLCRKPSWSSSSLNHEDENSVDMQFSITRVHINEKEGILETNGWLGLVPTLTTTSIATTNAL